MTMKNTTIITPAYNFVRSVELPESPQSKAPVVPLAFHHGAEQAFVVGSQINIFTAPVALDLRADVTNCTLLAQLAANKKVGCGAAIYDWYNAYFEVLFNIGWVLTENKFESFESSNINLEVHEAIIKIANIFLGGAPGALAIVLAVVEAMAKMDEETPWITLFNRQSQKINNAAFQIAVADQQPSGEMSISLMAFGIESTKTITQVLLFKFSNASATLRSCSGKVTINEAVMRTIRQEVQNRVVAYSADYVAKIDI